MFFDRTSNEWAVQDSNGGFTGGVIVTNKAEPYVLGTRMREVTGAIAELEIIWITKEHWQFDAEGYLKYSSAEKWDEIPASNRDSRPTLMYAANSYMDAFVNQDFSIVPWGYPCVRIEGGAYTARGGEKPDSTCEVSMPSGLNIVNRRFVIDETVGAVVVFCNFGAGTADRGSGAPDSHLFRVENGKIRYVHTLTYLLQSDFKMPLAKGSEYLNMNPKDIAKPKGKQR